MLFPAFWRQDGLNDWYVVGANYPGIPESGRGGYQLGPNHIMGHNVNQVTPQTLNTLRNDFQRLKNMGCDVVRMFALTQGQGITWQPRVRAWSMTGLDPDFRSNVTRITAIAADVEVKIYWTLLNGGDFRIGTSATRYLDPTPLMRRSFYSILNEGDNRDQFFRHVLPSFLSAISDNLNGVFAIDLMNEPDTYWFCSLRDDIQSFYSGSNDRLVSWVLSNIAALVARDPTSPNIYINFLRECAIIIQEFCEENRIHIPKSIGCCRFHTLTNYMTELDAFLDFFDYHHYDHVDVSNTGLLPLPAWNHNKPCIIGECGLGGQFQMAYSNRALGISPPTFSQAYGSVNSTLGYTTLQTLFDGQADCITNIMNDSFNLGYAGCIVWEYGKQYTDTARLTSPYRPRTLSDEAHWGDRFYLIWKPNSRLSYPYGYVFPLFPADPHDISEREVVQVIRNIADDHRDHGRCPPRP